jgi:hypothetical protein
LIDAMLMGDFIQFGVAPDAATDAPTTAVLDIESHEKTRILKGNAGFAYNGMCPGQESNLHDQNGH